AKNCSGFESRMRKSSLPYAGEEMIQYTKDGTVDRHGRQAIKAMTGGWRSAVLILERHKNKRTNLQSLYAMQTLKISLKSNLFSVKQCLILLALSSQLLLLKPSGCGDGSLSCGHATPMAIGVFYLSIYLVALGNGGYQPSIATFGADQFDEEDEKEGQSEVAFLSWFYLALNLGSLFSNTVLGYFEDNGMWPLGFWMSALAAIISIIVFLIGTPRYRHHMPGGNPLPRIGQVFVAATRKWRLKLPSDADKLHELPSKESAINGSRKILHSAGFRSAKAKAHSFSAPKIRPPSNDDLQLQKKFSTYNLDAKSTGGSDSSLPSCKFNPPMLRSDKSSIKSGEMSIFSYADPRRPFR
ncbi:hypothetical protein KI387_024875, partial [Taxus chinensis]